MSKPSTSLEVKAAPSGRAQAKQVFKRGLAALLPTLLTLIILFWAFQFLRDKVGFWISGLLTFFWERVLGYTVAAESWLASLLTVVGILIAALAVFILGYFLSTVFGRWVYGVVDGWLSRLPVIRQLYPSLKQVINFRRHIHLETLALKGKDLSFFPDGPLNKVHGRTADKPGHKAIIRLRIDRQGTFHLLKLAI